MSAPRSGVRRSAPAALAAVLTATAVAVGGCGMPELADLPLPGGAPSGPAYRVTVEFTDVLDLVPQAAVKVNDVTVGSVEEISLSGWTARARLRIDRAVRLPANATAAVRQTSLLGEKYVAVAAPVTESASGQLGEGAVIPLSRTKRSAEVEEVLAALGLLLNGGGLAQLKTINEELSKALEGRESTAKDALRQLDAFVGGLDRQRADLVRAVDALDRLTGRLSRQRAVLGDALAALDPGLGVLAAERDQLSDAVTALGELGRVGSRVVVESREDTVASLRALQPILDQLVRAGDALPKSLDFMLSYPFPPNVTGAIVGDFINMSLTADLDAATILANLFSAKPVAKPPPRSRSGSSGRNPSNPSGGGQRPGGTDDRPDGIGPLLPGVLPAICLPVGGLLPLDWLPPLLPECKLPPECKLLGPGSLLPLGGLLPPGGVVPPGTVFPPGTRLPLGTILTPGCLLPPPDGATNGRTGGLLDVLGGGLLE
ncbi:MCE family protein [Plantactinospora soyae]|uniref:Phospholipid/cholesterol/gamma-HCH transport system substrate-binding protein n=1 Tax=Plantactinospora soyae TaxID=1544732 RepID=A0A927R9L4_9ACTN|nr:MCE family protein [Plantactinospora soyae]MBE1489916.1 phospholipid/cholesterol/gamma-HCH transport system substrate-binding protein [Plantactinospora soyae]